MIKIRFISVPYPLELTKELRVNLIVRLKKFGNLMLILSTYTLLNFSVVSV